MSDKKDNYESKLTSDNPSKSKAARTNFLPEGIKSPNQSFVPNERSRRLSSSTLFGSGGFGNLGSDASKSEDGNKLKSRKLSFSSQYQDSSISSDTSNEPKSRRQSFSSKFQGLSISSGASGEELIKSPRKSSFSNPHSSNEKKSSRRQSVSFNEDSQQDSKRDHTHSRSSSIDNRSTTSSLDSSKSAKSWNLSDRSAISFGPSTLRRGSVGVEAPSLEGLYKELKEVDKSVKDQEGLSAYRYLLQREAPKEVIDSLKKIIQNKTELMLISFKNNKDVFDEMNDARVKEIRKVRNALYQEACSESSEKTKQYKLMFAKCMDDMMQSKYIYQLEQHRTQQEKEKGTALEPVVYTLASIEINGELYKETQISESGGKPYRSLFQYPEQDEVLYAKLRVTATDAEIETLYFLDRILSKLKSASTENTTLRIGLKGNKPPCEGCEYRIEEFIHNLMKSGKGFKEIIVDSSFAAQPSTKAMQNVKGPGGKRLNFDMECGSGGVKVETATGGRFFTKCFTDQTLTVESFPERNIKRSEKS